MSVTLLVLKLLPSVNDERFPQLLNMFAMLVTLAVLKLPPRLSVERFVQPQNIPLMFVTLAVFKLLRLREGKDLQP